MLPGSIVITSASAGTPISVDKSFLNDSESNVCISDSIVKFISRTNTRVKPGGVGGRSGGEGGVEGGDEGGGGGGAGGG